MKKTSTLFVVATVLFSQLSYSQVKRQYQDELFAETTVVIKEEDSTDDMEVLNQNFDMDEVGMGQVIRITTEHDRVKIPVETKREVPVVEQEKVIPVVQTKIKTPDKKEEKVQSIGAAPVKTQSKYRSSGRTYAQKSSINAKKVKRKKVKRKKRKKISKNGKQRCYSF